MKAIISLIAPFLICAGGGVRIKGLGLTEKNGLALKSWP
jgi:hypothetical protein